MPSAQFNAVIIGGSFAGLAAAMYIARGRRSVCIVDAGQPRNRFAAHSHGFLGSDGIAPRAIIETARAQVAAYPTVTFVQGTATHATRDSAGFRVTLDSGQALTAVALVLAFGVSDELPDLPGLRERWGSSVLHCPYCHGYEFGGRRLGVLHLSPMSVHQAMLIADWGPTTLYLNGAEAPDDDTRAQLHRRGIVIEPDVVTGLHGAGTQLQQIELHGGRTQEIDALYLGPRNHLNSTIAAQLGCEMEDAPLGTIIRTDAQKMTTVPGVFAAGDITRAMHNVSFAVADGVMAGTALHRLLVFPAG